MTGTALGHGRYLYRGHLLREQRDGTCQVWIGAEHHAANDRHYRAELVDAYLDRIGASS